MVSPSLLPYHPQQESSSLIASTWANSFTSVCPPASSPSSRVPSTPAPASGFFVQIAAFKQLDGAQAFHRKVVADLSWLSPLLAVFSDSSVHRLQAGPYRSRDEAQNIATQIKDALKLVPVVLAVMMGGSA